MSHGAKITDTDRKHTAWPFFEQWSQHAVTHAAYVPWYWEIFKAGWRGREGVEVARKATLLAALEDINQATYEIEVVHGQEDLEEVHNLIVKLYNLIEADPKEASNAKPG